MKCKLCNTDCIIPTSAFAASSQNILMKTTDGTHVCSACFDAQEFATSVVKTTITKTNLSGQTNDSDKKVCELHGKNTHVKAENKIYVKCNKCTKTFSGPMCECGFKNPLYKRK
jgi:hypothetical protein